MYNRCDECNDWYAKCKCDKGPVVDIREVGFSTRVVTALISHGIETLHQFRMMSQRELLEVPGFGIKCMHNVEEVLKYRKELKKSDNMKKLTVVTPENLSKLWSCFSKEGEFSQFLNNLQSLNNDLTFNFMLACRIDDASCTTVLMKQVFAFSLFVRDHMELVNELVRNLDCKMMTEQEIKDMQSGNIEERF